MNVKEAKDELKSYIDNKKYIDENLEKLEEEREKLLKITSVLSDMPVYHDNSVPDRKAEAIATVADLSIAIAERIKKNQELCNTILATIDKIPKKYANVLICKYINGMSFEKIGDKLGYTEQYVKEMNGISILLYIKARNEKEP